MIRKISLSLLSCLFIFQLNAKSIEEYRTSVTNMMLEDNIVGWQQLLKELAYEKQNTEFLELLLASQYGLMGYLMANEDFGRAKKVINDFEYNLSLVDVDNDATLMAYHASISGFRIALNPSKAISLLTHSKNMIEKALKIEPENSIVVFVNANALFFSPEKFGGDQRKALAIYEKSFEILNRQEHKDWIYYGVGAWLVRVYFHFDMLNESRKMCELLLKNAPDFKLIKEELYPVVKQSEFDKKWEAFLKEADED